MVEHLKVRVYLLGGGLMVEPACASLTVEPAYASLWSSPLKGPLPYGRACLRMMAALFNLLIGWGGLMVEPAFASYGRAPPDLISRAPKGDGGQSSLLTHPLQFTYLVSNK